MADINKLIQSINKKYKKDIVMRGTDIKKREMIPFTSPKANWLTRGGIAKGKMSEFYGGEGAGKTTLALDVLANYQKLDDRPAVYLDAENTLDKEHGTLLGVNWEKVILIKPDEESAETLLDMILDLFRSGEVGFGVIDSIPFLMSEQAVKGGLADKTYAGNSAVMTAFSSKIVPNLAKYDSTLIMINQIRDKIGVLYTAYNTPGGRMLKHSYVQRIYLRKGGLLDENYNEKSSNYENPIGHIIQMDLIKNKITKNDRHLSSFTLIYDEGIDVIKDTIDLAIYYNIIVQAGSWYRIVDLETGEILEKFQGQRDLIKYLKENKEEFNNILEIINRKVRE